jgi:putative phosphoesterase
LKLFVISDTHGKVDNALEIIDRFNDIDLIIHLGDMSKDAIKISAHTEKTVLSVRGNNEVFSCPTPEYHVLKTDHGDILLTHGHRDQVRTDLQRLLYRAEELECIAVFYGHTHIPMYSEIDGIYVLNPGSLSQPQNSQSGSYAIVDISKDEFSASIFYL